MAMEEEINNASKSLVKPDNMFSEIISLIQLVNISPGIKIMIFSYAYLIQRKLAFV